MTPEIRAAIQRGELVLFLGAGASKGSLNRNGDEVPSGAELARNLAEKATLPFNGEPLSIVYSAAERKLGHEEIKTLMESHFLHCRPSPALNIISSFPWPRIYTLNIDDALERALDKHSSQYVRIHTTHDAIRDLDTLYQDLDYVKLNGSVKRLQEGLVFSPQEYGKSSARLPYWYAELGRDFFRFIFVFIGTKISDCNSGGGTHWRCAKVGGRRKGKGAS